MILSPSSREVLSSECINAIEKFQMTMKEKEQYLAFYVRVSIPMSFDALTISPVKCMNSSIKYGMGVNQNFKSR
jgi:hypothetical protein